MVFQENVGFVDVYIRIHNDEAVEGREDFQVSLSNPINGSLGNPGLATVTIFDDDSTGGDRDDDGKG